MSSLQVDVQTIRLILQCPASSSHNLYHSVYEGCHIYPLYTKERSRVIAGLGLVVKGCKVIAQVH